MDEAQRKDMLRKTHPGFTVKCDKCGSEDVAVEISLGFSEVSGAWGSIDLSCDSCDNETELWSPY